MTKIDAYIEIARTTNTPFSSMGVKSCAVIQAILSKYYRQVGVSTLNTAADLELLARKQPDLVFLGLKKLPSLWGQNLRPADEIWLSAYLDRKQISYTGSRKAAIALDFDKASAKVRVRRAGIATAPFFIAAVGQFTDAADLPLAFPLFIKPLQAGGGKGIGDDSVVRTFAQFQHKVSAIFAECGSPALVEQYLTGREFSVAILDDPEAGKPLVMPIEIITEPNANGDRVLGSRVKCEDHEQVIAVTNPVLKRAICTLATRVYTVLGGRDLGRIDIRLDSSGQPFFLEANFMPGPGTRYFAGACLLNENMDYDSVLQHIVALGLHRNAQRQTLLEELPDAVA